MTGRSAWPHHVGILNDYVRIPYANGSSFASQFLYRSFVARGHRVTVVGPHDPDARAAELPRHHVCLPSLPMRNHPGLYMPMPTPGGISAVEQLGLDVALGQSGSELADLGVWLRWRQNIPYMCVNTIHLPKVYNVLLPDRLAANRAVVSLFENQIIPMVERHSARVYNQTDGLIVLSRGLERYWRERGVTAPIHVIPRAVDPSIFDRPRGDDPFPAGVPRGGRLLCVCRQTREKNVVRLLDIFARHLAGVMPEVTLTLVGDGPDFDAFVDHAARLGIGDRVHFVGEHRLHDIPRFYRHADLFVFTSLSETYGQVISEAMWCGLPVVALDDSMGVAQQVEDRVDGILVMPGPDEQKANWRFAKEVFTLIRDVPRRRALSEAAARRVQRRADPARCIQRYYEAFAEARAHCHADAERRRGAPYEHLKTVGRWTSVHTLLVTLGLLRPPATINRHGRRQPGWEEVARATPRDPDVAARLMGDALDGLEPNPGPGAEGTLSRFAAAYRLVSSPP
ncbi:MAG: glycosyltransferase [Myxococcota bacterium]